MKARCLWLTGLPCSGKTTIALELKKYFPNCLHLDGDVLRDTVFGQDVDFSPEGRRKHLLRMGTIAKLAVDSGQTVICSFVSPNREVRKEIRDMFGANEEFFEIFVDASLETCIQRDVKGMYAKALNGEISNFTGVQAPYEKPMDHEITVFTDFEPVDICIDIILGNIDDYHQEPKAMYIGRWNGIFHNGHYHIIKQSLDQGKNILLAIRDVIPDEKNPWTAVEVRDMLRYMFKDNDKVEIIIIPDISSVEYGRKVGYEVNEIKVTENIAGISGTECRNLITKGDDSWKKFVPDRIVEYMENNNE